MRFGAEDVRVGGLGLGERRTPFCTEFPTSSSKFSEFRVLSRRPRTARASRCPQGGSQHMDLVQPLDAYTTLALALSLITPRPDSLAPAHLYFERVLNMLSLTSSS